jgi:hypothetical protein
MAYVKRVITSEDLDRIRIELSNQRRKLSPEPVCDFCGDPTPLFTYAASRMASGEQQMCWRWAACKTCSQAIDRDEWPEVIKRCQKRLQDMLESQEMTDIPSKILEKAIWNMVDDFRATVICR